MQCNACREKSKWLFFTALLLKDQQWSVTRRRRRYMPCHETSTITADGHIPSACLDLSLSGRSSVALTQTQAHGPVFTSLQEIQGPRSPTGPPSAALLPQESRAQPPAALPILRPLICPADREIASHPALLSVPLGLGLQGAWEMDHQRADTYQ